MIPVLLPILVVMFCIGLFVMAVIFILVPIVRGGFAFGALVGRLIRHVFCWILGSIADVVAMVGLMAGGVFLIPVILGSIVLGRWSAAQRSWAVVAHNTLQAGQALYRLLVRRPLALIGLAPALEDVERSVRVGMFMADPDPASTGAAGIFEGYTIIDTLTAGGSGAKLFVATPSRQRQRLLPGHPDRVVIKCFDLANGSALPQMIRESRSLDAARRMKLVLEHGGDEARFWYVMPWIPGSHLGDVVAELHGADRGLDEVGQMQLFTIMMDLLQTLRRYHQQGLWHKDVKPENIIVNEAGAHLVDLGLVTPLASAMTLTTHGTEYFRDPELVRQALRGVKVSEIDGAKFDVYAAGAVMYYMLENTFPAHGGLSRFDQPSPEAAQWIVRRAMSDYDHRYATIGEMLEDVAVLVQADDCWSVRPAQLPSMGTATTAELTLESTSPLRSRPRRTRGPDSTHTPAINPIPIRTRSAAGRFTWFAAAASFVVGVGMLLLVGEMLSSGSGTTPYSEPIAAAAVIEVPAPVNSQRGLCLVILDHDARQDVLVSATIDAFLDQLNRAGWIQCVDVEAEIAVRSVLSPSATSGRAPVNESVRQALLERSLDAAVMLVDSPASPSGVDVVLATRDWQARWALPAAQPEGLPD